MVKLVNQAGFVATIRQKKIGVFTARDVQALFGVSSRAATVLLNRYAKRGVVVHLKRGLYALAGMPLPDMYIANKLYAPSYVSREFALSYHKVIPETVYEITSVSTKATRRFEAAGKVYTYRRIKKAAFTGYAAARQNGFSFRIADPEKAFVDALYYRMLFGDQPLSRFRKELIDKEKALGYARLYGNRNLVAILKRTLL
jgi:predicted transcriptional regulator of viral defense system